MNGIIISEFYADDIGPDSYIVLLESIKEHLYLLKRMQEEKYESNYNFTAIENSLLSYLHKIEISGEPFYISVLVKEAQKEHLLQKFSDFVSDVMKIMETLL